MSRYLLDSQAWAGAVRSSWCRKKGYFTPDEWRAIQPFIVSLAYPSSRKTRDFLNKTDSELIFDDDDALRGLRRMKLPNLYSDGLNGCGLDVEYEALRSLGNYVA